MPKSRSSRSKSPQKPLSAQLDERETIFQHVREMFSDTISVEVIHRVLNDCNWRGEDAIDRLLAVAEQVEGQKPQQSEFHQIAQGIFGSIRHEDYPNTAISTGVGRTGSQHIGSSPLSESERVIRPPDTARSMEEVNPVHRQSATLQSGSVFPLYSPSSPSHLTPGSAVTSVIGDAPESDGVLTRQRHSDSATSVPIASEIEFPPLPSVSYQQSSASAGDVNPVTSSGDGLVEQSLYSGYMEGAQTAYYHQDDDASRAQLWEEYKDIMGEHYLHTYTSVGSDSALPSVVNDVPIQISTSESNPLYGRTNVGTVEHNTLKASDIELGTYPAVHKAPADPAFINTNVKRPRHESSRSFPVRLLSKSPDGSPKKVMSSSETVDNVHVPQIDGPADVAKKFHIDDLNKMDSADLDETVLKCINEVNDQLLSEIAQSSAGGGHVGRSPSSSLPLAQVLEVESAGTSCFSPDPAQIQTPTPNNQPMTLPVIGLSVEAPVFIPRSKKKKSEKSAEVSVARPISEDTKSKQKVVQKSKPIEVKRNVKNVTVHTTPVTSPNVIVGSPGLIGSPNSLGSPISPPNPPLVPANSAHLTGSPMFITPKWGPPVYHNIQSLHPPPLSTRHLAPVPTSHITHAPRYIGPLPTHNAPYRVQVPPGAPLPNRVVFAGTAPPVFRVSSFSPHIPHHTQLSRPPPPLSKDMDNIAAIATGQPIMATGHTNVVPPTGGKPHPLPQSLAEQCVHRTRELQKGGNKVMVIIRGLPGSGKSTLARFVKLDGIILSTDDYFMKGNMYDFNSGRLSEAHQWNRERAKEAIKLGTSPIVIDNTNTQKWEFKPYVNLALNNNYYVDIIGPDTPWKFCVKECSRRTLHRIPEDHIARMLERYEFNITIEMLLNKKTPGDKTSDKTEKSERSKNSQKNTPPNKHSATKTKKKNIKPMKNVKSEWESSCNESCHPKAKEHQQLITAESSMKEIHQPTSTEEKFKPLPGKELELDVKDVLLPNYVNPVDPSVWEKQRDNPANTGKSVEITSSETDSHLNALMRNSATGLSGSGSRSPSMNVKFVDDAIVSVGSIFNIDRKKHVKGTTKPVIDLHLLNQMTAVNQLKVSTESDSSTQDDGSFYSCNSEVSAHSSVNASPRSAVTSSIADKSCSQIKITNSLPAMTETSLQKVKITSEMIKEIEEKLSEETLNIVHEILAEYVGKKDLSVEETTQIEEELTALLQFYPIEDEQRIFSEQLIGYRLNYCGLKDDHDKSVDAIAEMAVTHAINTANGNTMVDSAEQLVYKEMTDIAVHEFLLSEIENCLKPEHAEDDGYGDDMCFNMEVDIDVPNVYPDNSRWDTDINKCVETYQNIESKVVTDSFPHVHVAENKNSNHSVLVPPENVEVNNVVTERSRQDIVLPKESYLPDKINSTLVNTNFILPSPMVSHELSRETQNSLVIGDSEHATSSQLDISIDRQYSPVTSHLEYVTSTISMGNNERDVDSCDSESDTDDEREFQLLLQNLANQKAMTAQEAEILKSMSENGDGVEIDLLNPEGNPLVVRAKDNHFTEAIKKEVNLVLEEFERKYWGDKEDAEDPIEKVDTVWAEGSTDIPWMEIEDGHLQSVSVEMSPSASQRKLHRLDKKQSSHRHEKQSSCVDNDKSDGEKEQPEVNKNAQTCIEEANIKVDIVSSSLVNETVGVVEVQSVETDLAERETLSSVTEPSNVDIQHVGLDKSDTTLHANCPSQETPIETVDQELSENSTHTAALEEILLEQISIDRIAATAVAGNMYNNEACGQLIEPISCVSSVDSNHISVNAEIPHYSDSISDEVLSDNAIYISDDESSVEVSTLAAEMDKEINLQSHPPLFYDAEHRDYIETMQAIANMGPMFESVEDGDFVGSDLYADSAMIYDNALLEHDIDNSSLGLLINSYYNVDQQLLNSNNNSIETNKPTAGKTVVQFTNDSLTQEGTATAVESIPGTIANETNAQINTKPYIKPLGDICNSSTDNTPSSSCNASPNSNSTKRKKQSKRKSNAKCEGPFLGNADKERFLSGNWSSLTLSPDQAFADPKYEINNGRNIEMSASYTTYCNQATQTESGDFRVLNLLSQGEEFEYVNEYLFLCGRPRIISLSDSNHNNSGTQQIDTIPKVHKLDQSSSTDDLHLGSDAENLQFLKTCFPNKSEDELECVLSDCADNVEWAINLLLDWKYSLQLTEDEKQKFADEVSKVRRCKSPIAIDVPGDLKHQPICLLDSCFKFIEGNKIATREEIEQQLIQTGKERLDRIEDDNITKIRLRRSTSLSEASLNSSKSILNVSLYTPDRLHRSVSSPAKSDRYYDSGQGGSIDRVKVKTFGSDSEKTSVSELNDSVFLKSEIKTSGTSPREVFENGEIVCEQNASSVTTPKSDIDTKLKKVTPSLEKFSTRLDTLDEISPIPKTSLKRIIFNRDEFKDKEQQITKSEQQTTTQTSGDDKEIKDVSSKEEEAAIDGVIADEVEVAFSMNIRRDVVNKLEQLYGPVERSTRDVDFDIAIDHETAWRLYQCLRRDVEQQRPRHNSLQQIIKDEALARQLQAEQDILFHTNKPDSRPRNPTPLGGVSVLGTIPETKAFPVKQPPVRPLTEIMQEELALQVTQEEHQKLVELEGGQNALANRLKRRKLYHTFPGINTTFLDEIFQANRFSLMDTLVSISSSLGLDVPAQTGEAEVEFERQEMVDGLAPSRPCQDLEEPEYDDYRGEAQLHHRLRGECFQKAQDAYRRGLQQVASFYSQQGHLHTQKIKEANMRASEQILQDRNSVLEQNMTLDLHGLHVDEAIAALNRILPLKAKERNRSHLTIITGRGSHSRGGVARLRPSVLAYLQRHHYSFNESQPGAFRVLLRNRHDR